MELLEELTNFTSLILCSRETRVIVLLTHKLSPAPPDSCSVLVMSSVAVWCGEDSSGVTRSMAAATPATSCEDSN